MIYAEAARILLDYNYAQHDRIWASIDTLTDEQFVEPVEYSIGSLRNHMVHLMSVDRRWMARVLGTPTPERLIYDAYPTRAAVRAGWDRIVQEMRAAAKTLTDDDLAREVEFDLPHRGGIKHNYGWQIVAHVVNHGTEHRAQILPLLHRHGAPTFEQDLMIHLWDQPG
ncbi:MAG: DUF664 domain-containing protein [Chloroflexi bacterium]|nr:DUF664 domain-containing protein [Chloroflexota bacterium]